MVSPVFILVIVFLFLLMSAMYKNLQKPFGTAFFSAVSGTAGLAVVNLLGLSVAVNLYTLTFSCIMGLPGVVVLLILKIILQ